MKSDFIKSALRTIVLLLGLFALVAVCSATFTGQIFGFVRELTAQSQGRHSFGAKEGNGYYEDLMQAKSSGKATTIISHLITGKDMLTAAQSPDIYWHRGFLLYEAKPNLNFPNTVEGGPVTTNSYGLFDHEYSLQKPAHVRRIALFGDSVTRGWGVNLDQRYGNLLEKALNAGGKENFQVLNFASTAYTLPQIFDVAEEKASVFQPDVYLLAVTDMTGGLEWGDQLLQLINTNEDLKYDFLRNVAKESGIKNDDSTALERWKLAPYRQNTLRDIFLQMRALTERRSATLIVVFIPSAQDQDVLDDGFQPLRECLKNTNILVIDVSDTFKGKDIAKLRRNWDDPHPTAKGHQLIAENLYNKLRQNPEAWAAITGMPEHSSAAKGKN